MECAEGCPHLSLALGSEGGGDLGMEGEEEPKNNVGSDMRSSSVVVEASLMNVFF